MSHLDLWHVRTDALDAATCAACATLLTDEEEAKHARFVFEQHRHEYLVTRGLACGVLATYLAKAPGELAFVRTEHGRPLLAPRCASGATSTPSVRFSLTNTVALVACGVTPGPEIGIDAEPLSRADQILEIAATVFTPHEREDLARLALAARRRRAVELWTLKEAYMKARGLGFALPVQGFELVFEETEPPALRLHAEVQDDPTRWTFATHEVEAHVIATCVERTPNESTEVRLRSADLAALLQAG